MHYLKWSLSEQEKCHFGHLTLNARGLAPYLPGQRGLLVVCLTGIQRLRKDWQDLGICKGQRSVHDVSLLVPPSQSQNCWGGIQPLLLQCLKCCELPAPGTLLVLQHCFLFGSLSLKKHVAAHDITVCSLPWCSGSRLTRCTSRGASCLGS